jgi:arylsulfatase
MTGMTCQRVKAFKSKGNIAANNATSIAEVLGQKGYATILSGKWHIAPDPLEIGFQNYFGTHLAPLYFKRDVAGSSRPLYLDAQKVAPETLPDDWYGTTALVDYAIKTIEEKTLDQEKPFFLYLSVNAPHAPLSAPAEVVEKYVGMYEDGTDAARRKRYERMVQLGLINPKILKLPAMEPDKDGKIPGWNGFTEKEQRLFQRKLALAAAMVDVIDQGTGKLVAFLKETKQYDNTLFIFLSDNGATAEQGLYGGLPFDKMTGRDIDSLGTRAGLPGGTSGPIVAAVQNTPFRGYKTTLWDGGMHTSMIIHWPGRMAKQAVVGYVRTPVSIYDIAPTIYAATGSSYPSEINGRKIQPMDGIDLLPLLEGKNIAPRNIRCALTTAWSKAWLWTARPSRARRGRDSTPCLPRGRGRLFSPPGRVAREQSWRWTRRPLDTLQQRLARPGPGPRHVGAVRNAHKPIYRYGVSSHESVRYPRMTSTPRS